MPDEPQRYAELASFGEELRREREIRGISLKEISDATKISKRFLEAIEHNDHKTLPAPVFTRGFVREYARYLGLNAEEIVNRYNFGAAGDDRIEQSTHLERLTQPQSPPLARDRDRIRDRKDIPPAYARVDRNVYVLAVIVIALAGVSLWAFRHKREARAEEARTETSSATAVQQVRAALPVPPPQPQPAASDTMKMTIDVASDSWVILEVDGKTVINDELRRGDHRVVEAKEGFRFRTIGNAAGLRLSINGVRLPPLGRDGQVVKDRTFDRATLQELETESRNHT